MPNVIPYLFKKIHLCFKFLSPLYSYLSFLFKIHKRNFAYNSHSSHSCYKVISNFLDRKTESEETEKKTKHICSFIPAWNSYLQGYRTGKLSWTHIQALQKLLFCVYLFVRGQVQTYRLFGERLQTLRCWVFRNCLGCSSPSCVQSYVPQMI